MISTWTPQIMGASNYNLAGLENGAWSKAGATVDNDAIIIAGRPADKLVETAATSQHIAQQFLAFTSGRTYTFYALMKAGERNWAWMFLPAAAFGITSTAYFNLSTGAVGGLAAGVSATISLRPDGSYLCKITKVASATASGNAGIGIATADGTNSYLGVLTNGIYVAGSGII